MTLTIYQVDAFTSQLFGGNPAAIVPLDSWISEELMQKIASENNLSETAYFVKEGQHYHIRWFTPTIEVDLCGHATLASAHVIFQDLGFKDELVKFLSKSGELSVRRNGEFYEMNFPASEPMLATIPEGLLEGFNIRPKITLKANEDFLLVFENEKEVADLKPNFSDLKKIKSRGIICTAVGDHVDFVSRFFAPAAGIDEDPVTGSAHTKLIPYWANILKKSTMHAEQISARKGHLKCELKGDRVLISGKAVSYLRGQIQV